MKKLALVMAIVMITCLMFVACEKAPEGGDSASTTTSSSEQTQPSSSTQAPASSEQPSQSTDPQPAGAVWQDFSAIATEKGKGTEFSATVGIFTITRGKASISSGKTVKEGDKAGTSFTGGVQVGKNGSATDKCITFTVPAGCTYVEFYVNSATSGANGTFLVSVNGTASEQPCVNANITAVRVSVTAGATVAVYGGSAVSTNVWGINVA